MAVSSSCSQLSINLVCPSIRHQPRPSKFATKTKSRGSSKDHKQNYCKMGKTDAKKAHAAGSSSSKHTLGAGLKRSRDSGAKASTKTTSRKNQSSKEQLTSKNGKKTGLDEIDDLFAAKKTADKAQRIQDEKDEKERKKRRRERRAEEAALALGGSVAAAASAGASTASAAPSHLRSKAKSVSSLSYTRDDAVALGKGEWVNDGLGGIFDAEGFTGRKQEGTGKIYKAHLFNKKGFGTTPDCPFDCDCCFI